MSVYKCDDVLSLIRRTSYSSHGAYAQSKLALVLLTYYLQEQMTAGGFPVTVNAVDPGMVDTALYDNLWSLAQAAKKPVAKILFRVTFIHCLLVMAFNLQYQPHPVASTCISVVINHFPAVVPPKHFDGNSVNLAKTIT